MTSFRPWRSMTAPSVSSSAGPRGESAGGGAGMHSGGRLARISVSARAEGERECRQGARMKIVLKGSSGREKREGMARGYSNDSSWPGFVSYASRL